MKKRATVATALLAVSLIATATIATADDSSSQTPPATGKSPDSPMKMREVTNQQRAAAAKRNQVRKQQTESKKVQPAAPESP